MPDEKVKEFGKKNQMERPAQPAELAPVYVFLASNESRYITGAVFDLTGGEMLPLNDTRLLLSRQPRDTEPKIFDEPDLSKEIGHLERFRQIAVRMQCIRVPDVSFGLRRCENNNRNVA